MQKDINDNISLRMYNENVNSVEVGILYSVPTSKYRTFLLLHKMFSQNKARIFESANQVRLFLVCLLEDYLSHDGAISQDISKQ